MHVLYQEKRITDENLLPVLQKFHVEDENSNAWSGEFWCFNDVFDLFFLLYQDDKPAGEKKHLNERI